MSNIAMALASEAREKHESKMNEVRDRKAEADLRAFNLQGSTSKIASQVEALQSHVRKEAMDAAAAVHAAQAAENDASGAECELIHALVMATAAENAHSAIRSDVAKQAQACREQRIQQCQLQGALRTAHGVLSEADAVIQAADSAARKAAC